MLGGKVVEKGEGERVEDGLVLTKSKAEEQLRFLSCSSERVSTTALDAT